jgi:hypothetical protein
MGTTPLFPLWKFGLVLLGQPLLQQLTALHIQLTFYWLLEAVVVVVLQVWRMELEAEEAQAG